jgi:hypothetical protein
LLLWLIETDVFQIPQLHKYLNIIAVKAPRMLKSFFRSIRKSKRLKGLSQRLSTPLTDNTISNVLASSKLKGHALDDLIALCKSDENVAYVINEFGIDDMFLKNLYGKLISTGAGQYAGDHFVAASSLAYAYSLKFLLDHFDGEAFHVSNHDARNSSLLVCARLIRYFKNGEAGPLE